MRRAVELVRWNASRNRNEWFEELEEEIEVVEERNKRKEAAERKAAEREAVRKVFESILNLGSLKPIVSPQLSEAQKLVFLEETLKEKRLVYFRQICPKSLKNAIKTYQSNTSYSSYSLKIQQEEVAIEKKARFYKRSRSGIKKPLHRV